MASSLGDLMFRLGADVSGFKDAFRDAVEILETAGDKATKVGAAISKAFDNLGASDATAKLASKAKSLQASFELLERAYKDGRISADDFAKAQAGLRTELEKLGGVTDPLARKFDKLGEALQSVKVSNSQFQIGEQVAELSKNIDYLEKAYKAGELSAADFAKAQKSVSAELDRLAKADFTAGIDQLSSKLSSLGSKMQDVGKTLSAAVTLPIIGLGGAAVKAAADFESLEIGLKAVTKETGPLAAQLDRLREVAKLPGLGFKEAVQGSINLQAAGFSASTAERGLKAFGNALATVGKGRADLDGVITALSQIASKGKVSAEEINQLAERLPQIRVAIKDAFGPGFSDAKAFEAAGISSEVFVDKIIQQFERLPVAAGGFKNDLENLRDGVEQSLASVGKALLPFASKALQLIQPLINSVQGVALEFAKLPEPVQAAGIGLAGLAAAAGPALYAFGGVADGLGKMTPMLATVAEKLAPQAAQAFGAMSLSSQVLSGALVALAASVTAIAFYDVVSGAVETAQTLDQIYGSTEKAKTGLQDLGNETKQTKSRFAELTAAIGSTASYLGDHFWNLLFPSTTISRAWDDLQLSIKGAANRFPELEAAAAKAQSGVAASMRAMADQAMNGLSNAVKKSVDGIYAEKAANLEAVKVAEETLKTLKKMHASKEELAVATERLTAAQRKLHPELTATGNAAGVSAKKVDTLKAAFDKLGVKGDATDVKQFTDALATIEKAYKAGKVSAQDWHKAQEAAFKKLNEAGLDLNKVENSIRGLENVQQVKMLFPPEFFANLKEAFKAADEAERAFQKLSAISHADFNLKWAREGLKSTAELEEAFKRAGVSTENLAEKANQLTAAYQTIQAAVATGGATQLQADEAHLRVLQAQLVVAQDANAEAGRQVVNTRDLERQISDLDEKLSKHGVNVKGVKDSWRDFSKEVSTIVTNFAQDVGKTLFDGTKDWGQKFTKLWTDLKTAIVATFITPVTAALTKFVSNTLADLLGGKGFGGISKGITDIGATISKVFGGLGRGAGSAAGAAANTSDFGGLFGSIAGTGATAAQAATKTASSGASAASSALGSVSGIANLVTGAVSSISAVVSNFQFAHMNTALGRIEESTRYAKAYLLQLITEAQKYWPRLEDIKNAFFQYFEYFASLMTTVEGMSAGVFERLDRIAAGLSGSGGVAIAAGDGSSVQASGTVLDSILTTITDGSTNIVAAVQALAEKLKGVAVLGDTAPEIAASTTDTASSAAATAVKLSTLQERLNSLFGQQSALLGQLPPDLVAGLKAGETPVTDDANWAKGIEELKALQISIQAVQDEIAALQAGSSATSADSAASGPAQAFDPETGTFDTSLSRPVVQTGTIDANLPPLLGAISALSEMIAGNFATLFQMLEKTAATAKGVVDSAANKITGGTTETTAAVAGVEAAVSDSGGEVAEVVRSTMDNVGETFAVAITDVGQRVSSAIETIPQGVSDAVDSVRSSISPAGDLGGDLLSHGVDLAEVAAAVKSPAMGWNGWLKEQSPLGPVVPSQIQTINVTGNTFRNQNDADYLVSQLGRLGVRT